MVSSDQHTRGPAGTAVLNPWRSLLAALGFLTIVPIGSRQRDDTPYFGAALFYFPVVGLLLGSFTAIILQGIQALFPMALNGAVLTVLMSLWSGFIHMDGLADTADGFLSGKPRDECLDIMRDSRVGVMGCVAIAALLLVKTMALISIAASSLAASLVLATVAGRCSIVWMMALLPYARSGSGLGRLFYSEATRSAAIWAVVVLCITTLVLMSGRALALLLCSMLSVILLARVCRRKIGGATGDTLGAACELVETVVLLVCAATL